LSTAARSDAAGSRRGSLTALLALSGRIEILAAVVDVVDQAQALASSALMK
jgi:hypothetical protein